MKRRVLRVTEDRPAVDRAGAGDDPVARGGAVAERRARATPLRSGGEAARVAERLEALERQAAGPARRGRRCGRPCSCRRCRGRRCGRRSRTSSRSRRAARGPRRSCAARARAPRRARSRGRGRGRARPSRPSAARCRGAAPRRSRSPRPRRRRRAGARSPTSSRRPGARRARSPSAAFSASVSRAVVERGRGAVRVHVVDLVGLDARRPRAPGSIARAASRPVGSGAVRWWASERRRVAEQLAEHARRRARAAASASSSTRTPAPSPITNPSRRASKGRETPRLATSRPSPRRRRSRHRSAPPPSRP